MLPAEEFAIHCGFAAAPCGKASPYRGRVFNLREASPRGGGVASRRFTEPDSGKAQPYRKVGRPSRSSRAHWD